MTFLSPQFFCFFPVTALVYFLLPRRVRNIWLLLASWFFYLCAKPAYLALLLLAVVSTWVCGLLLEKQKPSARRGALISCLLLLFALLFVFKYLNFTLALAGRALNAIGLDFASPAQDLILPVGISFYLFQAAGYVVDVHRGKIAAERSFVTYALFVSFFPQLVSGPINRAGDLLPQFREEHPFDYDNLRVGLVRFLWGAFKKTVLADRLAVLVGAVFAAPGDYGALQLIGAAAAFSIQLYCDFSGYSDMAVGAARVMGFRLMENFRTPFFSRSIAEFWRRWHISLSSWFRDYLYIPLGGSRRGTARKWLNILIVFAVSGLWHGAALTFIVWGLLNGLYQVVGGVTAPLRGRVRHALGLRDDGRVTSLLQIAVTFALFSLSMVFFKAGSLANALEVLSGMVHGPLWAFRSMGLDRLELLAALFGLLVLLLVDLRSLKRSMEADYLAVGRPVRWLILLLLLFSIVIFGSYGAGYDAQAFIYGFSF